MTVFALCQKCGFELDRLGNCSNCGKKELKRLEKKEKKGAYECFRCRKEIDDTQVKFKINGVLPSGGFDIILCHDCWDVFSEFMWNDGKGLWSIVTAHYEKELKK